MKKLPLHIVGLFLAVCTLQTPGSIRAMGEEQKPTQLFLGFVTVGRLRKMMPEGGLESVDMRSLQTVLARRFGANYYSDLCIITDEFVVVEEGMNLLQSAAEVLVEKSKREARIAAEADPGDVLTKKEKAEEKTRVKKWKAVIKDETRKRLAREERQKRKPSPARLPRAAVGEPSEFMRSFREEVDRYRSKTAQDQWVWAPGLALVLKVIETEYREHKKTLDPRRIRSFRQEIAALDGMVRGEDMIPKGFDELFFMPSASEVARELDELP